MFKTLLKKLFALPPVEKRRVLWPFGTSFFQSAELLDEGGMLRRVHDDVYIYYLILERGFFALLGLLGLYVISYFADTPLNFYFFVVDATGTDLIEKSFYAFSQQAASLLVFFLLPFHLAQLRFHFDFRTYDYRRWAPKGQPITASKGKRILCGFLGSAIFIYGLYFSYYVPFFLLLYFPLSQSFPFFLFSGFFLAVFLPSFIRTVLTIIPVLIQFLLTNREQPKR